jgi:hypothetical protein
MNARISVLGVLLYVEYIGKRDSIIECCSFSDFASQPNATTLHPIPRGNVIV